MTRDAGPNAGPWTNPGPWTEPGTRHAGPGTHKKRPAFAGPNGQPGSPASPRHWPKAFKLPGASYRKSHARRPNGDFRGGARGGPGRVRSPGHDFVAGITVLDHRAFRILQREPQFLGELVDARAVALPGAVGLEAEVADAAAPRGDDAADGAEVCAVGV